MFCFHDIGKKGRYAIPLEDFRRILDQLTGFRVVSLKDWVSESHPEDLRARIVLTFDDGYSAHRDIVLPELEARHFGATFFFYADQLKSDRHWVKLAANNHTGFDYGSHSWSHALLRDVSYEEMFRELYLARNFMEDTLKKKVESFAWPYGYYSPSGTDAARHAGFAYQVSVDYRIASRKDIAGVIPRYTIYGRGAVQQVRQILDLFRKANAPAL